jgi:transposase, IS30 family
LRNIGIHHDFKISHETIYRHIRKDRKAGGSLFRYTQGMSKRHISTRPAQVEGREVLGHWEGDTVIGQDKHACILTLVERKSGLVAIKKLNARTVSQTN